METDSETLFERKMPKTLQVIEYCHIDLHNGCTKILPRHRSEFVTVMKTGNLKLECLSHQPCEGASFVVSVFEIKQTEVQKITSKSSFNLFQSNVSDVSDTLQLAPALQVLHDNNIVRRDFKLRVYHSKRLGPQPGAQD